MDAPVYILTPRKVLHKGAEADGGGLLTFEACNLDDVTTKHVLPVTQEVAAFASAKRVCRRCFPNHG